MFSKLVFAKQIKTFITDFIYGAFGLVVMNVIMQFFVNRLVINQLGASEGGLYLYVTAILTLGYNSSVLGTYHPMFVPHCNRVGC